MKVELILNPKAQGYEEIQNELRQELRALKKTQYTEVSEAPPQTVLTVEHDVVKFVFAHPDEALGLARGLVELILAVIERLNIKAKNEEPPAVIVVKTKHLPVPSSPGKVKRFLDWIKKGSPEKPVAHKKRSRKRKSRK